MKNHILIFSSVFSEKHKNIFRMQVFSNFSYVAQVL